MKFENDAEFEELLIAALYRAAELDYEQIPPGEDITPSPRFLRKMNALLHHPMRILRKHRRPAYLRVMRAAAAVFAAVVVLLGTTVAVSPTARAYFSNVIRTWLDDSTEYRISERLAAKDAAELTMTFGYMPKGFELTDETIDLQQYFVYQNRDSMLIHILLSDGNHIIDNEHSDYYRAEIGGREADVYKSNDEEYPNILVLFDSTADVIITVISEININEIIRIGEHINIA